MWNIDIYFERKRVAGLNELGKRLNFIALTAMISKKRTGEGRASEIDLICFSLVALLFFVKQFGKTLRWKIQIVLLMVQE